MSVVRQKFLPITHYPLPITHYPLPITHYPLLQLIYPISSTILYPLFTQINSKNTTTYYDDSIAKI
ncbi:hypothetical protein FJR37_12745 [Aphanizomenon sp. UHCC 0183]|nr:hypothetical protein [Aphanizomenon sp. UHCC 0183]